MLNFMAPGLIPLLSYQWFLFHALTPRHELRVFAKDTP